MMSSKTNLKATKTKTALRQGTYNLSDLKQKHDSESDPTRSLHCGVVDSWQWPGAAIGGSLGYRYLQGSAILEPSYRHARISK